MYGYWVFNDSPGPVDLLVDPRCVRYLNKPPVKASATVAQAPHRVRGEEWRLHLSVEIEGTGVKDTYNYLGVAATSRDDDDRLDYPEPPPFHGLSLSFPHPEWKGTVEDYTTDIRSSTTGEQKPWTFIVDTDIRNANVIIRWDFVGSLGTRKFMLSDKNGDAVVNLRDNQTHTYTYPSAGGGSKEFQITVQ